MTTWIALFRGINVGGRHKLPMKDLKALLEALGLDEVRTYIQSGNVVFRGADADRSTLAHRITGAVGKRFGFEPQIHLLAPDEIRHAVTANPFPEAAADPRSLHLFFLQPAPTDPPFDRLDEIRSGRERYLLRDDLLYLHTPDGFGRSKLAERAERLLQVSATARNWRTVNKLAAMAAAAG